MMKSYRKELWFNIPTRRGFVNITRLVEEALRESGIREGLLLVNAMHISASADNGLLQSSNNSLHSANQRAYKQSEGQILEFSMIQPALQNRVNAFQAVLVRTTNTYEFSQPSPDPSGLTYISSRNTLLISDADVEETKSGVTQFMGANLWEVVLDGTVDITSNISSIPPTMTPMTNEPAGAAWNPGSGHYFFSDDHGVGIFELNAGIDGVYGTLDDSWSTFIPDGENADPEGIAYDGWHDRLFVSDGVNREIYQYTLDGCRPRSGASTTRRS